MKYVFKKYESSYPELFLKEKERLSKNLGNEVNIEHVGSTAIPGLGGKGIIDIAIGVKSNLFKEISENLGKLGYEFKPNASNKERLFFKTQRPDISEKERLYHIHLTDIDDREWKRLLAFRDYLRIHPEDLKIYAETKKQAASECNQDKDIYMKIKEPVMKMILKKAMKS